MDQEIWTGLYFDSVPIRLEAIPNPGYDFVEWQSPTSPQLADSGRVISQWYLKSHDTISAVYYSPTGSGDTLRVIFTEINYRSYDNAEADDWIEIYNGETDTIDLSNWTFRGVKHYNKWTIPQGVKIAPKERLVLAHDTSLFQQIHPEVESVIGPFDFGLSSKGTTISLWDELDRRVSLMSYLPENPWPDNSNTSQSIELIDIDTDYQLAENWVLACPGGSPGIEPQDCEKIYPLVFTEINYKSISDYNTGDWIEILNNSDSTIDISHWILKDSDPKNSFSIPANYQINAHDKLIIAKDTSKYFSIQNRDDRVIGPLDFGFSSSGENISLSNNFGLEIINISYTNSNPWPEDIAGSGYTIELIDENLDMENGENWTKNCFLGTPLHSVDWCIQPQSIIISEIKYQSAPNEESGDWIELYNSNEREVNLMDWKFILKGDTIQIDTNYLLEAYSYISLLSDSALFYQVYNSDISGIDVTNFDLDQEEGNIFLLNSYSQPGSILSYHYLLNWPVIISDTNNQTLELMNNELPNNPESWRASCDYGTPSHDPSACGDIIDPNSILISEIKYNSSPDDESGDWIELYNTSIENIDLYHWNLEIDNQIINISSHYILEAGSYVSIVSDSGLFYQIYDSNISGIDIENFDLQREEGHIKVLNQFLIEGNVISYNHLLDWPVFLTDTNNRTLELIEYENPIIPQSWRAGCSFGTPSHDPSDCNTDGIHSLSSMNYQLFTHPNPTTGQLNIEFFLSQTEKIELLIINSQSNIILHENRGDMSSGKHIINLDLQRLQSGIYFLQIRGEQGIDHKKIIKIQ